jgi:hypothetical protein
MLRNTKKALLLTLICLAVGLLWVKRRQESHFLQRAEAEIPVNQISGTGGAAKPRAVEASRLLL